MAITPKSEYKYVEKVFNSTELHFSEVTSFKIGTLMSNDIGSGVSFKSIYFDFFSTNIGSSVIGNHTSNGFDDITH